MIQAHQPTIFDTTKLRTVISSRADGNVGVKWGSFDKVAATMTQIVGRVGATLDQLAAMNVTDQIAWDTIVDVDGRAAGLGSRDPNDRPLADALVTNTPGLCLLLQTADCHPVIMHDPVHQVAALVHLGWQSTTVDLAYKVAQHLKQKYEAEPGDIRVYIGPAIKAESYIFKETLSQETDIAWQPFLRKTEKGVGIDLLGFNRRRLKEAGVAEQHIEVCPVDTALDKRYFSHYRAARSDGAEPEGRFATVCMLV